MLAARPLGNFLAASLSALQAKPVDYMLTVAHRYFFSSSACQCFEGVKLPFHLLLTSKLILSFSSIGHHPHLPVKVSLTNSLAVVLITILTFLSHSFCMLSHSGMDHRPFFDSFTWVRSTCFMNEGNGFAAG